MTSQTILNNIRYVVENLLSGNYGEHYYLYAEDYAKNRMNEVEAISFFEYVLKGILERQSDFEELQFISKNREVVVDILKEELKYCKEYYNQAS